MGRHAASIALLGNHMGAKLHHDRRPRRRHVGQGSAAADQRPISYTCRSDARVTAGGTISDSRPSLDTLVA